MKLNKYNNFLLESAITELILESKLELLANLRNVLYELAFSDDKSVGKVANTLLDIAKSEKVTKELLQKKMVEVKIQNDEQLRIKNEAIEHYMARNATLDDDISRLQNRACRSGNTVPRTVQDRERKEETNVGPDRSLFAEAVALLNECYFEIDKIPTK